MNEPKKRHRLTKMVYDEVSLVDVGANQHAHVVIAKADRQRSSQSSGSRQRGSGRQAGWYSSTPDGKGLGSTSISAAQRKTLEDDKVKRDKAKRDKKDKETERAENWKEERHARKPSGSPAGGEFDTTSSDSKRKYGRGGTTKEKLERLERRKQRLLDRQKREDDRKKSLAEEKVKAGDTLWAMAEQHYGDGSKWKLIAEANGITDPKKLQIGTVLQIPKLKGSGGSGDSDESGESGSSSRRSRRRRSSSGSSSGDEDQTREERLEELKDQREELMRLLRDVDAETSTRRGDIEATPGVIVRPDGTIVRKNHRRRQGGRNG